MYTTIPLTIRRSRGFSQENNLSQSIAQFLEFLVSSPCGSFEAEPEFGFIFKNFRFENFNEEKGVLYSSNNETENSVYYTRKIHGRSVNHNTFAVELKHSIERYEPRLSSPRVNMEYNTKEKLVVITITGVLNDNSKDNFKHQIKIHVW